MNNKDKSLNKQDNQKLQISILACEIGKMEKAGRGGFAVKLSKALDDSHVSADISAYTVSISRTDEKNKNNTNYSVTNKKLGDKIRINTQNSKTEITLIEKNREIESLSDIELNKWPKVAAAVANKKIIIVKNFATSIEPRKRR